MPLLKDACSVIAVVVPAVDDPVPEPVVLQYAKPAIAAINANAATTATTIPRFFLLFILHPPVLAPQRRRPGLGQDASHPEAVQMLIG
jgi:hypothetical protein